MFIKSMNVFTSALVTIIICVPVIGKFISLSIASPQSQSNIKLIKNMLRELSSDELKGKCWLKQIDLNNDGKKEVFIRRVDDFCGGVGRCSIWIGKPQTNKFETVLDGISTSPDFAVLSTRTQGWKDIATRSYLGKEFWTVWKFDAGEYKVVSNRNISSIPSSQVLKSKPCSEAISSK
jgi:hypothetical protein